MTVATLSCLAYFLFHLFLRLKKHLVGHKFHGNEVVKNKVTTEHSAEFSDIGIQKIVPRLNKCLTKVVIMLKHS